MRHTIVGASTTAILLLTVFTARPAPKAQPIFLWVSDVHFDPTANPALTDALAQASVSDWPKILDSSPGPGSKFGEDTDWRLLASAIEEIRKTSPKAQFTVATGDIFVHHFREKFNQAAKNHDDAAFRNFAAKTFQFVAIQLASLTPGKPVLFTLGNNDSDCGDYELQPQGPFLQDTKTAVAKMLGRLADQASETDWLASGSYSAPHPVLKQYRVVSLNTVYFSPKYRNACATTNGGDAAEKEMHWFAGKLAEAKAQGEKVWLLFHIAPGIDGYATSHPKGGGEKKVVPMWKPEYTAEFQRLLQQYHDSVTISLAGHEHMDDFRLIDHSLVLLAPGLSPLVGQNPAFRVVGYQRSGELTDATTYYLSNLGDFDGGQKPLWQKEYSFGQNWSMLRLGFPTFDKLFHRVEVDSEMRSQWMTLYGVSHPESGAITPKTFPWLFCAAGNVSETKYDVCLRRLQSH